MAWSDRLLDETGARPVAVTCAAVLGAVTGFGTLMGGAPFLLVVPATGWAGSLFGPLVAGHAAAAVLLVAGAARIATGAGRAALMAGAALELPVCAVHLLYAVTAAAPSADTPALTSSVIVAVPLAVAAITTTTLVLARHPTTTGYLRRRVDERPSTAPREPLANTDHPGR
ncbi:hypothetical protein AB0I60_01440 [Actinosynnema sp. NPDC050436]|uniref:hypothetical protein n=1 Tax=Actinosynnema sp. NPDC050436 TaxID=3155659 RepID=UPI0033DFA327